MRRSKDGDTFLPAHPFRPGHSTAHRRSRLLKLPREGLPRRIQKRPSIGMSMRLEFHPLTPARWGDLEQLFGSSGACAGCWCMWWRLPGPEFSRKAGAGARAALRRITRRRPPGILAYHDRVPIGWCSVAPRVEFMPRLSRWTPFRRQAEALNAGTSAVWSIVCFFVDRTYRGKRVAVRLLREAVRYAGRRGAAIVEAYPVDAAARQVTALSAYTGTAAMFRRAGFREVVRAYPARPVMRRAIRSGRRETA